MTIVEVMDHLADFLKDVVGAYLADSPESATGTAITVYSGYPYKRTNANTKESYIYALVTKCTDTQAESTAEVEIGFNIYSAATEDQGRMLFNLMEHVRQELLKHPCIAKRILLNMPLQAEIPSEQPEPHFLGVLNATYVIGRPTEVGLNYDDFQEISMY